MRYDVAIIGAGADGLAAASLLARARLKVVVLERAAHAGGRCVTCEFAPGFFASPYADTVAAIPPALLPLLGLPPGLLEDFAPVGADIRRRRAASFARVLAAAATPTPRGLARLKARWLPALLPPWPAEDWAAQSITTLRAHTGQNDWRTALAGRASDPDLAGSALTLLAAARARPRQGGLGALGAVLEASAVKAGAEIRLHQEVTEIALTPQGVAGVQLGDGSYIEAAAVISTLDLKRTFLGLFRWGELPPALLRDVGAWRDAGARARILLALEAAPAFIRPFFVPGDGNARAAFRQGVIPMQPPLLVDPVSARDPSLAPPGKAVVALTLSCIPPRLFDGGWTAPKRALLLERALGVLRAVTALPEIRTAATIVAPDVEDALGLTGGDLDGGALAPDQMNQFRPGPRTALQGLYLAGPSSAAGPLGLTGAGIAAAVALMADRT